MPIQIRRLIIAFAIFIGLMLVMKYFLTPDSWREYGPYRGNALDEIADMNAKYVEMETCAMCHDSIAEYKNQGMHKTIECETCHDPGYKHIDDPELNPLALNKEGTLCLRCHLKNPARPSGIIKQIDPAEHNTGEECITCHNPHSPWL